ncbi:PSD1 and planctomycete cytochrome C domain-containing protein [Neorhodopirellula lusitana]|uniref:PSD1 and planctomycete cytochrome C domain-containing protein n=1 Tax=Neorhodopirellula lusitana TaxID=445327 RepID=UPI00384BE445
MLRSHSCVNKILLRLPGLVVLSLIAVGSLPLSLQAETADFPSEQLEFFEKQVRPLLSEHCYECHSAGTDSLQAGLMVDSRSALIEGGDSGESIIPGDAEGSLFMEAVRWESYEMPPKGKLPEPQIETLSKWIDMGAPWPKEAAPEVRAERKKFVLEERAQEHWAWQPIDDPAPPSVNDETWPRADLDRFVLAKLEDNELTPAADADRLAVMRRLYQDIIGLPPTPEQTHQFINDTEPGALERLVDTLLESPHYGERWGRHWLDLVRYAESRGHEFDDDAINAFQYRDYVIRAFNADVPHDQLVREHIAGDLLDQPRINPEDGFDESILGTGFWFLGEWVHSPVDILKDESDRFDNMVDVMSKAFLGVTVACARCHDHKFDAISTADYYSLTGFLQSSDYRQVRFDSIVANRQVAEQLAAVDHDYRQQVRSLLAKQKLTLPETPPLPEAVANALVLDFNDVNANQFLQDGYIFGDRPHQAGDPFLNTSGDKPSIDFASRGYAVNDPAWNGLKAVGQYVTQSRSKVARLPRSGRTLRTPSFEVTGEIVGCSVSGAGHVVACVDSHRLVAGPLHSETIASIKKDASFVELNLTRYKGHRIHLEFTPAKDAQLEVAYVVQGSPAEVAKAKAAAAEVSYEKWEAFGVEVDDQCGDQLAELATSWKEARAPIEATIVKKSRTAMAMLDGTGEDAHVYIRGNSAMPGDVEPRHFLTAIAGREPMKIASGSGRLELADNINDPANPLTSRVIVNRIWHYLMGRGIVPTTDDFGVLGQRPTHPELLDHLATQFLADGRSIKSMIRHIVLSRTYQMSSQVDADAVQADPLNLLWHHRPPKRLEGEAIRDSLLAIGGNLNETLYGPSVPVHLTSFMNGRGRPKKSGPLDGEGRRSIYVSIRRNFLSPFMLTFDTPVPFSTMGRRNVSNVPAQALILMNDPFVVAQASDWAERAMEHEELTDRIEWMYVSAFARKPTVAEFDVAMEFVGSDSSVDRWAAFAHALINTKEFIFLR